MKCNEISSASLNNTNEVRECAFHLVKRSAAEVYSLSHRTSFPVNFILWKEKKNTNKSLDNLAKTRKMVSKYVRVLYLRWIIHLPIDQKGIIHKSKKEIHQNPRT